MEFMSPATHIIIVIVWIDDACTRDLEVEKGYYAEVAIRVDTKCGGGYVKLNSVIRSTDQRLKVTSVLAICRQS